jgi:hydroxyacylglutathione hydrolase
VDSPALALEIATVVSSAFEQNAYIVHLPGEAACLVVDPGLEPEKLLRHLDRQELVPAAILLTHGHIDHTAGTAALKKRWPDCPVVIGRRDAPKLIDADLNLSASFGLPWTGPPADRLVGEGDMVSAAGIDVEVRDVPGHTCGHVVFVWKSGRPLIVFVGDVIFAGSIGRTDFPDGDYGQLAAGIRAKLYTLPDDTLLYSGHGPATTVGDEKEHNSFVRAE